MYVLQIMPLVHGFGISLSLRPDIFRGHKRHGSGTYTPDPIPGQIVYVPVTLAGHEGPTNGYDQVKFSDYSQ